MQIPSLVQEVFECYLTSYPLSNSIFQSFKEFIFDKFSVPAESRLDVIKLTRAIRTKAYKYPLQDMRLHPSRDFQIETPPQIAEILDTMAAEAAGNPKMQPPSATPPAASVPVVSLLPRKASPDLTHQLTSPTALVQASSTQQQAFDYVFQSLPTMLFVTVNNFLQPLTESMHPLLPTNEDGSECIIFPVPLEPPTSATLFIDLYRHCSTPNHYVLISKPVFHRSEQVAYRQLGRMGMCLQDQESDSVLQVIIYWMGGQNLHRSFSMLDSTSEYTFQVSRDPETQTVSCISPPPGASISVFPEHPFYLPRWLDGFYQLLDKESEHIQTFLRIPLVLPSTSDIELEPAIQTQSDNTIPIVLPSTSDMELEPAIQTQSDNTSSGSNSKAPKKRRANVLEVTMDDKKTSRLAGKTTKCDVDGMACSVTPTYCRLGATLPTRCAVHRTPEMVLKTPPAPAPAKQPASPQRDPVEQEPSLLGSAPTSPTSTVIGKSIAELYGPQVTSPPKTFQCREKSCKKKATYTHEDEDDDSIPVLCEQHGKLLPGAYVAKGVL